MVVVLVATLAIGSRDSHGPRPAERMQVLRVSIRCPTSRGQSVTNSDSRFSAGTQTDIHRRSTESKTSDQSHGDFVGPLGEGVLAFHQLVGHRNLVSILTFVLHRWRATPGGGPSAADAVLVETALRPVENRFRSGVTPAEPRVRGRVPR